MANRVAPPRGPVVVTRHVVAMTDTRTLVAHLVTDEAVAAGRRAGRYGGLCGEMVLPGSLREETRRWCPSCLDATVAPGGCRGG